jgi:hypothetical protein
VAFPASDGLKVFGDQLSLDDDVAAAVVVADECRDVGQAR